jgi:hypothetical protein
MMANPLCFLAEVHGNRTHLGGYQPPTLDLKSRRPTSDLRTSRKGKISKGLMNVKMISKFAPVGVPRCGSTPPPVRARRG